MNGATSITFRSAAAGDIPVIRDLSARIWRAHYPGIIGHDQIDYMLERMYDAGVLRDEILNGGHRYVLVLSEGAVVGYLAYRLDDRTQALRISKLYLLPALHGRGIGRRMLQQVKDDAVRLGAARLYLFVNKNNHKAIRAYERFGFVRAGSVIADIGGGFVMDDFRMEMDL